MNFGLDNSSEFNWCLSIFGACMLLSKFPASPGGTNVNPHPTHHKGSWIEFWLDRTTPGGFWGHQGIGSKFSLLDCDWSLQHQKQQNFLICDASNWHTGACLSFGETWETTCPVAYDSMQLNSTKQNYPIHEKELLAIIHALKKWCSDLLGSEFVVYTDHRTLVEEVVSDTCLLGMVLCLNVVDTCEECPSCWSRVSSRGRVIDFDYRINWMI